MKDQGKTKEQLISELADLRQRVAELGAADTERKRAEEALRESEERYRTLREEAPISLCNVDLNGKITYVNKRFEEVSGYSREEVVGKNGLKLGMFSDETLNLLVERIRSRLKGEPTRVLEVQFKCKDARWIWVNRGQSNQGVGGSSRLPTFFQRYHRAQAGGRGAARE